MLPNARYIIFKCVQNEEDLDIPIRNAKAAKFRTGNYNRNLFTKINLFNTIKQTETDDFTVYWGTSPEADGVIRKSFYQKINHFPQSKQLIGNKAEFANILQSHPLFVQFPGLFPHSYVLPHDHAALYQRMKTHPSLTFISKPPRGSGGAGIKIITFKDFYSIKPGSVVSDYISRPLLIDGFKFDLRIYALVTSYCPLRAFVFKEGLARFATQTYTKGKDNPYACLTNATLNKKTHNYCSEFKWKLSELLSELEKRWGKSPVELMKDINLVVAKTLVLLQSTMTTNHTTDGVHDPFFEIYGFDILIDHEFHMWLLEVNTFPFMGTSEDSDFDVKGPLLAQALSIVGIPDMTASEMRNLESKMDLSTVDLGQLEADKIAKEDERNKLSGNGFIRIFPSELTKFLDKYCIKPAGITKIPIQDSDTKIEDAKTLGESLTGSQGMVLLIHILTRIENNLQKMSDPRLLARVQCFLVAQGYSSTKGTANTRAILHHFIDKVNHWVAISKEDFIVPVETRKRILSLSDDVLSDVLSACEMKLIKNVRLLFP